MYIRRVKRKCGIRGCRNTDCFAISRAREIGNTVIMCSECLKDALAEIDALDAPKQEVKKETAKKETTAKKKGAVIDGRNDKSK